jgi:hypothetical protein
MVVTRVEDFAVQVAVRAMMFGQRVGELRTQGDFQSFDGIEEKEPKFAVEHVQPEHVFEVRSWEEGMFCLVWLVERARVGRQAVVADVGQIVPGAPFVLDAEPALPSRARCSSRLTAGLS